MIGNLRHETVRQRAWHSLDDSVEILGVQVIDAHVHLGRTDALDCSVDLVLRAADRLGICQVCAMDLTAIYYEMREGNDLTAKAMRQHPDRIMGYATILSPRFARQAVEEVVRCHETYGMQGVKIYSHPAQSGDLQPFTSVAEPDMLPVLEKAAELGLPVLAHCTPAEAQSLASRVPDVTLIVAHAGGTPVARGDWHGAIYVAERYPNILLETCSSTVDMGQVELAVERLGAERVIFGTDMFFLNPAPQLARITGAEISDDEKRLILGDNIRRLFGLAG